MRRVRTLPGLIVLAALAVAGLAVVLIVRPGGSADRPRRGGPLGPAGVASIQCIPGRLGSSVTDGFDDFTNSGRRALEIERVTLASARHLTISGAFVLPGRSEVGIWTAFPPPARQLPRAIDWQARRTPSGYRVTPGHSINVVVGLTPTSRALASTAGLVVLYRQGNTEYELKQNMRVIVKVGATCGQS